MTHQEKNVRSQLQFISEFQSGADESVAKELLADNFFNHTVMPGFSPDKEGVIQLFGYLRSTFGKMNADVHSIFGDGDKVFTHKSFHGKHIGEFFGVPATGRDVTIDVMDIVAYRNGQISEHWGIVDAAKIMQQITSK